MEILDIKSTYVVLVHFNELPMLKLATNQTLEEFSKSYGFRQAEARQDGSTGNIIGFLFRLGIFNSTMGQVVIKRLDIEDRKLIIEIEGETGQAAEFFSNLVVTFAEMAGREEDDFMKPIVVSCDSEIICSLSFHISKLLSRKYLDFIQERAVETVQTEFGETRIIPSTVTFSVEYSVKDSYLSDHRITMTRKEFSVQPAIGHPIEEQIYYSKAPLDTRTHVQLLQDLEGALSER